MSKFFLHHRFTFLGLLKVAVAGMIPCVPLFAASPGPSYVLGEVTATGPPIAWSVGLILLAVALFQLWTFMMDRQSSQALWLGLTAGSVALGALVEWPGAATAGLIERLSACFLHLPLITAVPLLWNTIEVPIPTWLRRYLIVQAVLAGVVVFFPPLWLAATAPARWLSLLPFVVAVLRLFWQALCRSNSPQVVTLGLGSAAVVVALSAEIILHTLRLGSSRPVPTLAWGALILMILMVAARRRQSAELELLQLHQHMDHMVEDRTDELTESNQRLQNEIAERQLAEGAMRMLESAVEQSVDGIAVADLSGGMQFINVAWAKMHGYEVFELLGYDLEIFHTPEQFQEQVTPLMERVQAEGAHQAEIEHRRRGGAVFPTWQTSTLLQNEDGEATGFVFIVRDITERQQAEAERRRLETKVLEAEKLESLGRLAERVANDYNNMLTGVLVNAGLALQEADAEGDLGHRLRQIEASAERAAEISDQLMAYAGQEQVGQLLRLSDLLRERRPLLEQAAEGANLELHLKKSLPAVRGNAEQIVKAVSNLLINAVESLEDKSGLVMLRTSVVNAKPGYFEGSVLDPEGGPGRYVFFEVSDTGSGMDEATRFRIFEPYFSAKKTGRGMGLAEVLGIVRAHHGGIRVFSQLGRGTTVEVLLPAQEEAPATVDEPTLSSWQAFGTALVVDDEQLVREVAAKVLQRKGFEVLTAANGREAIDIFAEHRDEIQVILLDFEMPEMDGEAFVKEVRRFEPQARVLLMSGYTERNATQNFGGGQLAGFLHKPFRPNELLRKVREVIERR